MTETITNMPAVGTPVTTLQELTDLPVGSAILQGSLFCIKTAPDQWVGERGAVFHDGSFVGGLGAVPDTTRVALNERMVFGRAVVALPVGSTFTFTNEAEGRVYEWERRADDYWCSTTGTSRHEGAFDNSPAYWTVTRVGHAETVADTVEVSAHPTITVEEHLRLLGAASERAADEARRETERAWQRKMEQLSQAACEWADENGLCSKFDQFMEDHAHLGLQPRSKDFTVTMTMTVTHVRSVSARNADAAEELALEEAGFREGGDYTMYSEAVTVDSIETEAEED